MCVHYFSINSIGSLVSNYSGVAATKYLQMEKQIVAGVVPEYARMCLCMEQPSDTCT